MESHFLSEYWRLNSPPVVFFSHPQAIKEIFALPLEKFDFKKTTHVFKPLMGERSLILQAGRSHQRQRQLMLHQNGFSTRNFHRLSIFPLAVAVMAV